MSGPVRVIAVPKDRNPFQESLYAPLRGRGFEVRYLDEPTSSQTLNLLLAPFILATRARRHRSVLHVHWVFGFVPAPLAARRLAILFRWWFVVVLAAARSVGYRVVWTAHNVVPHEPVFDDDAAARRALVRRCDVVVAMNASVARDVTRRFSPSSAVRIIPHGHTPLPTPSPDAVDRVRDDLRIGADSPMVLFFGRIEPYKGVPDLIASWGCASVPADAVLVVAGECRRDDLRSAIEHAARGCRHPVTLRLESVPDEDVAPLLAAADLLVYPFRAISTSGSLLTGLGSGTPCLVPDLPAFDEIPTDALVRFGAEPGTLPAAIERVLAETPERRAEIARAAQRYVAGLGWDEVAARYAAVFTEAGR